MAFLKSLFFGLLLLSVQPAFCQGSGLEDVQQEWQRYQARNLQEKMYVHTDKSTYLAGEIIWFRLYAVEAASHKPLTVSKVAYIDILDKDNKFIVQEKIALKEGFGAGSVFIPLGTASGNYKLRAYTAWMKNYGSDQLFQKPIAIINTLKNLDAQRAATGTIAVQLFPEGGNLVKGLQSKVAVKVTGRDGKGVAFAGAVIDENNDTVTAVHALKFGIGTFMITPVSNHTYYASLTTASGQALKKELPLAMDQGCVMQLDQTGKDNLHISVKASGSNFQNRDVYLFTQNGQQLQSAEQKRLANDGALFTIATDKLPEGITRFTLFNEARQPLCERLFFKKPVPEITLQVSGSQAALGSREKAELQLKMNGIKDSATPFNLSLSIYQEDSLLPVNDINIYNSLWLGSDLTGTIEQPDFYFSDSATAEALDNLMLTHGWRRFRWEAVLDTKKTAVPFPLEFQGHLVNALVTDVRTGKPAANIPTFLSIPGVTYQFYAAQSDSLGIARFDVKNYYGAGALVLQTNSQNDSVYRVEVKSPFAMADTTVVLPGFTFSKAHADALLRQSIGMQVQQVYRRDSLSIFRAPEAFDTIPFFGKPDYSYPLDVYTRFQTMEEVLREYVRPINVVQRKNGLHLLIFDDPRRQFFEGGELVLLDGVPVFDKNKIFAYDPLKVKKLDIVTRKYFLGPVLFNGIASFTTYAGNYEGFQLDPRSIIIDYDGLQLEREFYAPVYETEAQYKSRVPDFRNTLLWKPQVIPDKNGQAAVSFFTSDAKGTYRVVAEGLDRNGNIVVSGFSFQVR